MNARDLRTHVAAAAFATLLIACAAAAPTALAQDDASADRSNGADAAQPAGPDYSLITRRNIFDRNRRRDAIVPTEQAPNGDAPTVAAPRQPFVPPDPARDLVLKGVSVVDGRYLAFFEHAATGQIYPVAIDETLLARRVTEFSLDGVTVEHEGQTYKVTVGLALTGDVPARRAAPVPTRPTRRIESPAERPTRRTLAAPPDPDDADEPDTSPVQDASDVQDSNQSVLQRLLLRRQQELNR